ncbi:uncharacterized protein LOC118732924 [Rhagoletis pomonella]|uniref:uncharacterized protein LOC118732924 n=1 Tax=Rhagoletis pomonella TaxID=28610 RepID=UPI00177BA32D|nr:uncharacterized protein LOC118732924 [Rhagoletis pomonella]
MTFEYSQDIAKPPEYLNLQFIEDVTENALRETNVKIIKASFSLGSAAGENYCSLVYRMKVQYELAVSGKHGELSVIVKCLPPMDGIDFLDEISVFVKEKTIFEEMLPKLSLFLQSGERFGGRLYHAIKRPVNCLAFEDLNVCGYQMASRERGLNEKHARLVMKRIGQFHAVSMHLAQKDPHIPQLYNRGMLSRNALKPDGFLLRFFSRSANALLQLISKWPDYMDIAEKLQKYIENIADNLVRAQAPSPDDTFRVLNHGDLWVNNILFKYDDNHQVQDCIFIDYQMTVWTSPGVDLNYFLYTSLRLDVLKNKRDELLKEYYHHFRAKLVELNYNPLPSFQQICGEVRRRASYGLFVNYGIYPLVVQDKEVASDSTLDNMADADFAAKKLEELFASVQLTETLRYTLREFDKMGVWD